MKRSERQIADLLEPTITALGLELWGVEHISQGRHSVLRIYIDNPDGISIEDCERVSRQVSAVLDVEDPIAGEYNLEVSSPGADRRLFSLEQFNLYVGNEVSVRLRTPIEGRRKLQGRISEVTENTVCLEVDSVIYQCPFEAVEKANLVF
ncbi:MAG: ribosome maturation factor RimP [Gammaproteobacteria bacterium]